MIKTDKWLLLSGESFDDLLLGKHSEDHGSEIIVLDDFDSENSTVPSSESEEEGVDWLKEWDTLIET